LTDTFEVVALWPAPAYGGRVTRTGGSGKDRRMRYVGVGRRFLALLVDFIISLVWMVPFLDVQSSSGYFHAELGSGGSAAWVAISLVYFTLMEGFFGATVGKFATGIRVVKEDGTKADFGAALIRNVLRIIDGLFLYVVGAVLVWMSPTKQRLGDRVAKTIVVEASSVGAGPVGGPPPGAAWVPPVSPGGVAPPPIPPPPPIPDAPAPVAPPPGPMSPPPGPVPPADPRPVPPRDPAPTSTPDPIPPPETTRSWETTPPPESTRPPENPPPAENPQPTENQPPAEEQPPES
jgi:uncharacterized RDD family membrane protein YckC